MNHSFSAALSWLDDRASITARVWTDDDVVVGFDPLSDYVELYWLPIIGPSATWALRRIAPTLQASPSGEAEIPIDSLARSIGLSLGSGRNAQVRRTLARLVQHRLAGIDAELDRLGVRVVIPRLGPAVMGRLPEHLRPLHQAALHAHATSLPGGAST